MTPHYADDQITLWHGDALDVLRGMPAESVNCVVTSPPYYGLRDYGEPGQYGTEETPAAYVETLRAVFAEVRRVLAADGTLWLNLGDTYATRWSSVRSADGSRGKRQSERSRSGVNGTGFPDKSLLMIPERVVLDLIGGGWILRNKIVWPKTNPMPESVADRLSSSWEPIYMLSRSPRYWFDVEAVKQPATGRSSGQTQESRMPYAAAAGAVGTGDRRWGTNPLSTLNDARDERRLTDVWPMATAGFTAAHFAVFPEELVRRCVLAGCRPGGVVLDPFCGSGTTGLVALRHGRRFVGIDLSATYLDLALRTRLAQSALIEDVS